ncbi:MAG: AbrB/MazE/SpoVT family DNA-binding domain-containing protein [Actinobacteria bacterium]|nr:AbrB/MazE/SpoVT family DNA-binding domain-containing protein [Actinomycetota bacterium]
MNDNIKHRRRGYTRVSAKHQVTIPVDALREAGLQVGDEVRAVADGPGRVLLARSDDVIARYAGALTGVWPEGWLDRMRDEWER